MEKRSDSMGRTAGTAAKQAGVFNTAVKQWASTFTGVASGFLAANLGAQAFQSFLVGGLRAANESERVLGQLSTALRLTGNDYRGGTDELKKWAGSLSTSTATQDTAILSAASLAVTMGLNADQAKEATAVALDYAKATGTDLKSALVDLSATMEGNLSRTLKRFVPQVEELTELELARGDAIQMVGDAVRGSAAAQATDIDKLGNAWHKFVEAYGRDAMTAAGGAESLSTRLSDIAEWMDRINKKKPPDWFDKLTRISPSNPTGVETRTAPTKQGATGIDPGASTTWGALTAGVERPSLTEGLDRLLDSGVKVLNKELTSTASILRAYSQAFDPEEAGRRARELILSGGDVRDAQKTVSDILKSRAQAEAEVQKRLEDFQAALQTSIDQANKFKPIPEAAFFGPSIQALQGQRETKVDLGLETGPSLFELLDRENLDAFAASGRDLDEVLGDLDGTTDLVVRNLQGLSSTFEAELRKAVPQMSESVVATFVQAFQEAAATRPERVEFAGPDITELIDPENLKALAASGQDLGVVFEKLSGQTEGLTAKELARWELGEDLTKTFFQSMTSGWGTAIIEGGNFFDMLQRGLKAAEASLIDRAISVGIDAAITALIPASLQSPGTEIGLAPRSARTGTGAKTATSSDASIDAITAQVVGIGTLIRGIKLEPTKEIMRANAEPVERSIVETRPPKSPDTSVDDLIAQIVGIGTLIGGIARMPSGPVTGASNGLERGSVVGPQAPRSSDASVGALTAQIEGLRKDIRTYGNALPDSAVLRQVARILLPQQRLAESRGY